MSLSYLEIYHLRNLQHASVTPAAGTNVLIGSNGSGKTSFLEAIHVLGLTTSFRPQRAQGLIQWGSEALTVHGRVAVDGNRSVALGVARSGKGVEVRVDGSEVRKISDLARELPVQVMGPEGQQVVDGGPGWRRRLLDWGVFHVEHGFLEVWRRYHRALGQRNSALSQSQAGAEIGVWETELAGAASYITAQRCQYLEHLRPPFSAYMEALFPALDLTLRYRRGWPEGEDFREQLAGARRADKKLGFTRYGPHRADLVIEAGGRSARDFLSRGQQKLVGYALRLAQAALLAQGRGRSPVILVDDLAAELDRPHRREVLKLLRTTGAQAFVTATDEGLLDFDDQIVGAVFHVEQGRVREMI